jgi:hypothetical protein
MPRGQTEALPSQHQALFGFIRQVRYVVACIVAGLFFLWLAGRVIPSPNMDGTRALAAGPAVSLVAELAMLGGLAAAIIIGTVLTWPDAPHAGLFIASVGLIFLACHWGTVTLLLAVHHTDLAGAYRTMALQNIFWLFYILLGEVLSRLIYELIGTRSWPVCLGLPWPLKSQAPGSTALAAAYPAYASVLREDGIHRRFLAARIGQDLLAFISTVAVAVVLLFLLLKSQQPGQAIFACLVAFAVGAFISGTLAPEADAWVIWMTPPCIAAAGGLLAGHFPQPYPGHAGLFLIRTLPIYYASAGLAGAIAGYYTAVRTHCRRVIELHDAAAASA